MNIQVVNSEKAAEGKVDLPAQFSEPVSKDLITRAVITLQLSRRQPYGTKPGAGTRVSSHLRRVRKGVYRSSYGKGISRVPRKIMTRRGSQMYWVGAQSPNTVKGRRAHPPKAFQNWEKKINNKENRKAIRSAISATIQRELVAERGHNVPEGYPFVLSDTVTKVNKTQDAQKLLQKLGFTTELIRTSEKKVRAGRGKMRGRKYDRKIGPLIVIADKCELQKSASNIPGVEIVVVDKLDAEMLAPGAVPGRLTIFTLSAINRIKKENLFM